MSSFQHIPPYLLAAIVSYIPLPHLQYRMVNRDWDNAIKIAHSIGQYSDLKVLCSSIDELLIRMQQLTRPVDEQGVLPWPLHWKVDGGSVLSDWPSNQHHIESVLIPFLDSLQPLRSYSITFEVFDLPSSPNASPILAEWCLATSKPSKYNFFFAAGVILFETEEDCLSFFRAPGMKHVTHLVLDASSLESRVDGRRYSLSPLRDSDTVSSLQALVISGVYFRSEDAECLASSPYLTNLTYLSLTNLHGLHGMTREVRGAGYDTIICSPIMKNVKSFDTGSFNCNLGYSFLEAFALSQYLKNLTTLSLFGLYYPEESSLEPLLRCDATMPKLTSIGLQFWPRISEEAINVLTSPSSALLNRIVSLNLSYSSVPTAAIETLFSSGGLQSLKTLNLRATSITDEDVQFMATEGASSSSLFNHLQNLDLSANSKITNNAVVAIYSSKNLPSLHHLDFTQCALITADVLKDITALPPRTNLRLISFSFCMDDETKHTAEAELNRAAPLLTLQLQ